jgi:hypothetical protein
LAKGDAPIEDLLNYTSLLSHFPNDTAINDLLVKIKELNIPSISIELLKLKLQNNTANTDEIEKLLANSDTGFITIQLLLNNNKKNLISLSDDEIAKLALINLKNTVQKNKLTLLEKRIITKEGKNITVFFFEEKQKDEDTNLEEKALHTIAFVNDKDVINPQAFKIYKTYKIEESDVLSEKYEMIVHKIINENHTRANFDNEDASEAVFEE